MPGSAARLGKGWREAFVRRLARSSAAGMPVSRGGVQLPQGALGGPFSLTDQTGKPSPSATIPAAGC